MMRIAIKLKVNRRDNQIGMKSKAKAEPKVPGALGARPDPKPTPQKTMQRLNQDMSLK